MDVDGDDNDVIAIDLERNEKEGEIPTESRSNRPTFRVSDYIDEAPGFDIHQERMSSPVEEYMHHTRTRACDNGQNMPRERGGRWARAGDVYGENFRVSNHNGRDVEMGIDGVMDGYTGGQFRLNDVGYEAYKEGYGDVGGEFGGVSGMADSEGMEGDGYIVEEGVNGVMDVETGVDKGGYGSFMMQDSGREAGIDVDVDAEVGVYTVEDGVGRGYGNVMVEERIPHPGFDGGALGEVEQQGGGRRIEERFSNPVVGVGAEAYPVDEGVGYNGRGYAITRVEKPITHPVINVGRFDGGYGNPIVQDEVIDVDAYPEQRGQAEEVTQKMEKQFSVRNSLDEFLRLRGREGGNVLNVLSGVFFGGRD